MKRNRFLTVFTCILLLCATLVNLSSCSKTNDDEDNTIAATDLMRDIAPNSVQVSKDLDEGNLAATDFALRLFREAHTSGNTLISPLSVLYALAMTSNGADGITLVEMESVLGMSVDDLNNYLYSYVYSLPQGNKYQLNLANSVWFTNDERFTVNNEFLQKVADYYGADVYKAPFNDQTLKDINNWVNEETHGMIPKLLEKIPDFAIMYLINTIAFEAEWSDKYADVQVRSGNFTKEDGTKEAAEFMYKTQYGGYLENESCTGFIKSYQGNKYAFVALLPDEDISIDEFVSTLSGETLLDLLNSPQRLEVRTSIPKFKSTFDTDLADVLCRMGMPSAFDPNYADLTKIGSSTNWNLSISRVLHKTYIQVAEQGTKAGAVTAVEVKDTAAPSPSEYKMVYLDRPFVYIIIDLANKVPIFIGTMTDTDGQ